MHVALVVAAGGAGVALAVLAAVRWVARGRIGDCRSAVGGIGGRRDRRSHPIVVRKHGSLATHSPDELSLLCFNILAEKFGGDWDVRWPQIQQIVAASAADLVLLQEVDSARQAPLPAARQSHAGMHPATHEYSCTQADRDAVQPRLQRLPRRHAGRQGARRDVRHAGSHREDATVVAPSTQQGPPVRIPV
jgi:hypothetical protein